LFASTEHTLYFIAHPELLSAYASISQTYFPSSLNYIVGVMTSCATSETLVTAASPLPQFIILVLFIAVAASFYFSFFTNSSAEENTVDYDLMVASTTIEGEEEIASVDDIIMAFVVIMYVFG